jgi:hypothetical protein
MSLVEVPAVAHARNSRRDESQKILIDHIGLGREHAMGETGIDLQRGMLKELRGEKRGTLYGTI